MSQTEKCCDNLVGCVGPIDYAAVRLLNAALKTIQLECELGMRSPFNELLKSMAVAAGVHPHIAVAATAAELKGYCVQLTELVNRMGEQGRVYIIAKGPEPEAPEPAPRKKKKKESAKK